MIFLRTVVAFDDSPASFVAYYTFLTKKECMRRTFCVTTLHKLTDSHLRLGMPVIPSTDFRVDVFVKLISGMNAEHSTCAQP